MNWREDRIGAAHRGEGMRSYCRGTACSPEKIDPEFRRVNLDVLGNADAFVHAHIGPRYEWEPPSLVTRPVWLYEPERWRDPQTALGAEHAQVRARITTELDVLSNEDTVRISG